MENDTMKIKLPAICGHQGKKVAVYQACISPFDLKAFIGHDPRSRSWKSLNEVTKRLYEFIQRKTNPHRHQQLAEYIDKRILNDGIISGALPAISIGCATTVEFNHIDGHPNIGTIEIGADVNRLVFDGLARVTAILNMLDNSAGDAKAIRRLKDLTIPVTLYAPRSVYMDSNSETFDRRTLAQLFFDFNVMRTNVTGLQARGKDSASPYVQIARDILSLKCFELPKSKKKDKKQGRHHGLFNEEKATRFVRAALEDVSVHSSMTKRVSAPIVTSKNWKEFLNNMEVFWTRIAHNLGDKFQHPDSVMFTQHGFASIAGQIYRESPDRGHFERLSEDKIIRLADAVSSIDWMRTNSDWVGVMLAGKEGEDGKIIGGAMLGGAGIKTTAEYVTEKTESYLFASRH